MLKMFTRVASALAIAMLFLLSSQANSQNEGVRTNKFLAATTATPVPYTQNTDAIQPAPKGEAKAAIEPAQNQSQQGPIAFSSLAFTRAMKDALMHEPHVLKLILASSTPVEIASPQSNTHTTKTAENKGAQPVTEQNATPAKENNGSPGLLTETDAKLLLTDIQVALKYAIEDALEIGKRLSNNPADQQARFDLDATKNKIAGLEAKYELLSTIIVMGKASQNSRKSGG